MPLYRPSELRQFLQELGISPKKSLSQNFLIDGNIIKKIISSAHVSQEDIILEIGPGPGALTEALLNTGATVIAVEKDPILAHALQRLDPTKKQLIIFNADIMSLNPENLIESNKTKVIANLPYHITTPILTHLIDRYDLFSEIIVMVQYEVAKRFVSKPGNKDYGSITVYLNYFSTPTFLFSVKCHSFYPVPKVDSAVVSFKPHPPLLNIGQEAFFKMVRTAFEQRRKMLKNSLGDLYSPQLISDSLEQMGCSTKSRPEELSLDQFLCLHHKVNS